MQDVTSVYSILLDSIMALTMLLLVWGAVAEARAGSGRGQQTTGNGQRAIGNSD